MAETEPHSLPNAETIDFDSSKAEPHSLPLELFNLSSYLVTGGGGDHPLFSLSSAVGYSVQEVGGSGWSGFEILKTPALCSMMASSVGSQTEIEFSSTLEGGVRGWVVTKAG